MEFNYKAIFTILFRSLKDALKWSIWKWVGITTLSGSLGLLQFGKNFFSLDIGRSAFYAFLGMFLIYLARFFLLFFKNSLKYYHEIYQNSIFGEAIILLKDSFAQAHAYRKIPGHRDKDFMVAMVHFCNNLKEIFDKVSKSDCCVSLKVPILDNKVDEKAVLMTLTRDVRHNQRDTKEDMNTKHTLIGNTAFSYSLNKVLQGSQEKFYLNNYISNTPNYSSTSRNNEVRYESELVHPIIPIVTQDSNNFDCLGFLCVDSIKPNSFRSKYLVAIIEGVADGLYDIISLRNQTSAKDVPVTQ